VEFFLSLWEKEKTPNHVQLPSRTTRTRAGTYPG